MRRQDGISLIEMLVAVLVLSFAVVGLFRVFDASIFNANGQRDRALALIIAQNRAESIALRVTDLPAQVRFAGRDWAVDTQRSATRGGFVETTLRVTPVQGGAGASVITYVAEPAR